MALVISTTHSLILLSFVFLLHNDCDLDFLICQGFFFFFKLEKSSFIYEDCNPS